VGNQAAGVFLCTEARKSNPLEERGEIKVAQREADIGKDRTFGNVYKNYSGSRKLLRICHPERSEGSMKLLKNAMLCHPERSAGSKSS
jgi:hypothetical protein